MPMKMARASEQDLEVAQQTASFIESLQKEWVPEAMDSDNDVFDIEDPEQCQQVLRKLLEINDRGSLFRVTFGMLVLLDPANKLIDPDADTLEPHPDVTRLQAENAALQQRLTIADQRVNDLTTLAKQAYMEGWELGWVERHTDANNEKRVSPWAPPRNVMEREWLTSEAYTELKGIS